MSTKYHKTKLRFNFPSKQIRFAHTIGWDVRIVATDVLEAVRNVGTVGNYNYDAYVSLVADHYGLVFVSIPYLVLESPVLILRKSFILKIAGPHFRAELINKKRLISESRDYYCRGALPFESVFQQLTLALFSLPFFQRGFRTVRTKYLLFESESADEGEEALKIRKNGRHDFF